MVDPHLIGIGAVLALLTLLACGIPVSITLGVVGVVGMLLFAGKAFMLAQIQFLPYAMTANYGYAVLPLFVLMGTLASRTGMTIELYEAMHKWLSRFRGGLYIASIVGSAVFAAASGSTVVNAVVFTRMALPEMIKHGYSPALSAGCIAASGSFAAMIPPSLTMVIYAIITQQSVGMLFIAGFLPGILSAIIYTIGIMIMIRIWPSLSPTLVEPTPFTEKLIALRNTWPIGLLIIIVLGGIYAGFFAPSAAGAAGAFGVFCIALVLRKLSWKDLRESLENSASIACVIFFIIIGGLLFARLMVVTENVADFVDLVTSLTSSKIIIVILFCLMYIILGALIDTTSMMIITLPFVFPVIEYLQINPIWFGIIFVKVIELSVISPPVGLNLYAVLSGAGGMVNSKALFLGVIPFMIMDILTLILLLAFPQIALWLPTTMGH